MALQTPGSSPNKASTRSILRSALANRKAADELINNMGSHSIQAMIVATSTSQTTDFGSLLVGDKVIAIPAAAGTVNFVTVATDGTLGQAAVIGSLYVVCRANPL